MSRLKNGSYHDGYANLAAAIIADGVRCHDTKFLESNWCDILREMCILDDKMYGDRDTQHYATIPTVIRRTIR